MVYTENMLARHFKVTSVNPFDVEFKPVRVKGRKSYKETVAIAIHVSENRKYGFAVNVALVADGHYRNIQWGKLSNKEKEEIQKGIGL